MRDVRHHGAPDPARPEAPLLARSHALRPGRPPRSVRDRRPDRGRRHGRGLQGARHAARAVGRDQGLEGSLHRALPERGARDRGAQSPSHLHAPRRGPRLPRNGVRRGQARARPASRGRSHAPGRPDRGRARARAPAGCRPPRPQALEHPGDEGRRQGARLRPREAAVAERLGRRDRVHAERRGRPRGDAAVHGSGADRRKACGRADGHLRVRARAVRAAHGPAGIRGQERALGDGGDPGQGPNADLGLEAGDAAGAGAGGRDLPGEGSGGAVAVRPRAEARARVGGPTGLKVCGRPAPLEGSGGRSGRPPRRRHRIRDRPSRREALQAPPRPARSHSTREGQLRRAGAVGRLAGR